MSGSLKPGPRDALLVIDVQNDFCPCGALAVVGGDEIVPVVNSLMPLISTVVQTQDWHPADHASFATAHAGAQPYDTADMFSGPQDAFRAIDLDNSFAAALSDMAVAGVTVVSAPSLSAGG